MIKAGMSAVEAIAQLTRGFIKIMGRKPDGLEKIKIQQEAIQRLKNLEKVVDMQGRFIDPSKTIMGGTQEGAALKSGIMKATGAKPISVVKKNLEQTAKVLEANQKRKLNTFKNLDDNKKLTDDEYEEFLDEIGGEDRLEAYEFDGTAGSAKKILKEEVDYEQSMFDQYRKGKLDPEDMAQGGRAGFDKGGMSRRTFMKILGGLASIPIIGKILKPVKIGKTVSKVPVIKTAPVAGKPEWFDELVNKVIVEGDDVTKRFATGERQTIHQKTLDDGSVVRVTEDADQGAVRVEYDSADNVFEDTVQMEYKRPLPDEVTPDPAAEFTTAESGPVGRQVGPDDYDLEVEEIGGSSIRDLDSDVSKLKEYATGKKPTIKEMMQNKRRKDRARQITEGGEAQTDAVIRRQGEMLDDDQVDFASGGIASMLGE